MKYLFCLFIAGCAVGEPPAKIPNQDTALEIVWRDVYGQTATPPTILWSMDDCGWTWPDHTIAYCVYGGSDGYGGRFYKQEFAINVPMPTPHHPLSQQPFAHELLHAKQWLEGIDDPNHTLPEWGELLTEANLTLFSVGL